jgi:GNAT superfamily N-acetyltransferase
MPPHVAEESSMQSIEPVMAWEVGPVYPRWSERLRDGRLVLIRPVLERDAHAERDFIAALSPEARRNRFLGQMMHPEPAFIRRLTTLDYQHDLAFAAMDARDESEAFVAVARYSTNADGTACECAISVLDAWEGHGLGTLLMNHLIEVARVKGVKYMWSLDSAQNHRMAELAKALGFTRKADPGDATLVLHEIWL